jgi:hypothetical protein
MDTTTYEIELELLTEMLGTVPKDPEVYATYIASLGTDNDDELETAPEQAEEKGWTGFHHNGNGPILYDYVIKGFFKDACGMLRRVPGSKSAKLTAYKKIIDGLVFVEPRQIPIELSGDLRLIERPLRAQTAQGERVALARSDAAPVGTRIAFTVTVLGKTPDEATVSEWLEYGQLRGLGQWRNSGAGRFTVMRFEKR